MGFYYRSDADRTLLLTKYLWPGMKGRSWGRVININSVHGLRASEFKVAYVSAKHGLTGLTKTAALEGGAWNHRQFNLSGLCPYSAGRWSDRCPSQNPPCPSRGGDQQHHAEKAAVKRLIEPSEVGDLVVYLCSDSAACITGTMLTIDCGWTAN